MFTLLKHFGMFCFQMKLQIISLIQINSAVNSHLKLSRLRKIPIYIKSLQKDCEILSLIGGFMVLQVKETSRDPITSRQRRRARRKRFLTFKI